MLSVRDLTHGSSTRKYPNAAFQFSVVEGGTQDAVRGWRNRFLQSFAWQTCQRAHGPLVINNNEI